jgi:hypothetical protein
MAQASQEEQTKGMEASMQWAKKCGDKLVDLGSPLPAGKNFLLPEVLTATWTLPAILYYRLRIWMMLKNYCKVIHILAGMQLAPLRYMKQCRFRVCKKD